MQMKNITTATPVLALMLLIVAGCQKRPDIHFYNASGESVVILSQQASHVLNDKGDARFLAPPTMTVGITSGASTNTFVFPYIPRSHITGGLAGIGRPEIRVQISEDRTLLVLPNGVNFPINHTNAPVNVFRIGPGK